ncbi:histone-lysine N-methyltransferase 2C-like isoform X7 [Crassostrea angulata]|uniref:histone-lysine N-methyltransferase 2C-like isoform X7 n=1 Tax=Magallana angulata TaxID=2784310 RepID=UPI0022B09335|nr:histone-lysine N-methyltransferase 2C-like isoform X7 [Crassostrea angulata]
MSEPETVKLENTVEEAGTQLSVDTIESSVAADINSDNSQSSTSVPPDITQAETYSLDDPYTSDPPDLNPEEDTNLPTKVIKKEGEYLTLPTYEAAELSDSSGPPDITSAAYEKTEEVEDIEIKDYSYVDSPNSPAPLLTSLEEQGEFTDFPTELPEDPQNIFPDTDPPPDLLHQEDLTPTEGYLGSSFPESSLSESLLAVAPGDILPVVSLPQINPNFFQQNLSPTLAQNIKRGPGRPRKDGQEPAPRRRSSSKPLAKSIVTKAQRILHNSAGISRKFFPSAEQMDSGSQSSLSQSELTMTIDTGEDTTQYEMEEEMLIGVSESLDETSLESQLPVRVCSFCNCGERSLLGQGDIFRFEPTQGFNFRKTLAKNDKKPADFDERNQEKEGTTKPLTWRRNRGPIKGVGEREREKSHSPRRTGNEEDQNILLGDELTFLGFPEDVEAMQVFEPTGHVWAHNRCAAWSEGVTAGVDGSLLSVDQAVFNGLSQKCSYCRRYGATITCIYPECSKKYHYPCAAAGACFQDKKKLAILCPDHSDQAETIAGEEAFCVLCCQADKIGKQLFCTSCGHHYHGACLHPSVALSPEVRAGWQCPDCKVCQMCRQPGEDSKMLVCDTCDKGYHTFCLKPVMTAIPKNGWKCKNCRVCGDCGSRTPGSGPSSRWHLNYSVCDSCYQQRNKGLSCPLCGKAYRQFTQKAMIQCGTCKKHVHAECDDAIDNLMLDRVRNEEQVDYMCSVCRNRDPELDTVFPPFNFSHEEPSNDMHVFDIKDSDMENASSNMDESCSSFLLNEDSISSMDIDINALEKFSSPPHIHPHGEGCGIGSKGGKLNAMSRKKIGVSSSSSSRSRGRPVAPEKKKKPPPSYSEGKRGSKTKMKSNQPGAQAQISPAQPGEPLKKSQFPTEDDDDGDDHPQTIILSNAQDKFVLDQDVCKSCGSFGRGEEGKLIVCTQCGQCYHPYCASVKVTKVILSKGWRCLDCTVCEGCGKPHDEGRLLLCDECDISYHIYCLDPPLDQVPKGTWKCKWCVMCINCGTTTPGFGCNWQNNYTQCGPCRSKIDCPVCRHKYQDDEMIIQCLQCNRWLHALCDGLRSEDDMERAADYDYQCLFCRPKTGKDGPLPPPPPPPTPPPIEMEEPPTPPFYREPEPIPQKRYLMDGVYLSETGVQHMQEITIQIPKVKRQRRNNKRLSVDMLPGQRLATQMSTEGDEEKDGMDESSELSTPVTAEARGEGDPLLLSPTSQAPSGIPAEGEKKERKKRTTIGLGVGGFIAKARSRQTNVKRQMSEVSAEMADGQPRPEGEDGEPVPLLVEGEVKKQRKRQARKKSQLENSFPNYLQEAFFGKDILDKSKAKVKQGHRADSDSDTESRASTPNLPKDIPQPSLFPELSQSNTKLPSTLPSVGTSQSVLSSGASMVPSFPGTGDEINPIGDVLPDLELPHDDIFSIFKEGELPMSEEQPTSSQAGASGSGELPDILSIENIDVDLLPEHAEDLPPINGQEVDDIFNGVLPPEEDPSQAAHGGGPQFPMAGSVPRLPPHMPPHPGQMPPGMPQLPYGPDFRGMGGDQPPWQQVATEEEGGGSTSSRRNMLKWECDEDLGESATISAVLYCNLRHPEFKQQYPDWSERVKKIAKAWRELSSDEKQPFLTQARKNRANIKTQDGKKPKTKVPSMPMGPPLPPGPQGQMPYPPPAAADNLGSPVVLSPSNRVPSNPSMVTTPEGHSPGQMPGSLPESPLSHPGTPQDPRMMVGHGDPYNPVMVHPGMRHPQGGPQRPPMARNPSGGMDPYSQDPYAKPPSTPQTPQKSPSKIQWPGQAQESDPYENPPATPAEGMSSGHPGHPYDPYAHPPHTTRPGMVPPQGIHRPPFTRQSSVPATQTSHSDDPYAFPPHTPGPRPGGDGQNPDIVGRQQGADMYPGMGDHLRSPYPPSSVPGSMGQPLPSTAPDIYRMAGQSGMRHPFRPPGPPTSQSMVRPDLYAQPLHPGMEPPREQSALQQMYAAASRRHALFPFSGMFSSIKHPYLGLQDKNSSGETSQQVRNILHKQAESRMRQGKGSEPPQPPWENHPQAFTSEEMTRFPVSRGAWPPAPPRVPGPRQIPHPTDMENFGMRPPYSEGVHPGQMRQPRPHGPIMPEMYSPKHSPQMSPGQLPSLRPGQNPLAGHDPRSQFPNMMEHRFPVPGQQVPPNQQQVPNISGQPQTYKSYPPETGEQSRINPGAMGEQRKMSDHDQREEEKSVETKEEKKELVEDKQMNEADIEELLSSDGTFDIIKFVDTDTELNLDENKSIFDDLDDVESGSMDKGDSKEDMKMTKEKMDSDLDSSKSGGGIPDFQSKFLEFSQKKNEERKIGAEGSGQMSEMDKKDQQSISQIAALLQQQSSEHMPPTLERRDSVKSDSSLPGKEQLPRTPGSGPLTPSGKQPGVDQGFPGMGSRGPYSAGMHSPLHQMQSIPTQPSPGSTYPPGQGPPTPGLPSPKIMPSPRSNIPSPRTPSVQSPFNPMNSQQSPFPQTQSPFSPTVSSAPQSPYAANKPQPSFSLPVGSTNQPGYSTVESGVPVQSPGQRSPRGTITPTNQYMQGTYGQPMMQGPPRATTLTPTPTSILYGGQSGMAQHGMRNPVPASMNGSRPPFSGASAHPMGHSMETATSQMHSMDPSAVPHMATSQSSHTPGDMQGHPPSSQSTATMPPYGMPGQRMPGIRPPMGIPTSSVPSSAPGAQGGGRPQLLQDQPLLIQDLLEQYEDGSRKIKLTQEKQEQQRQAQQQAMGMMQRPPPEAMMGQPPRPGMPMGQYRPRMEGMRHPVDPNWNVQRPYGQPEIPPGQPQFVRMPGQQMPPRMPGPYVGQPPGVVGPMGIPTPPPPPPQPPMTGELTPELERQQQQYEDWLMKHGNYLEMQVKTLEQQIGKCKRTKKAINARNRQAKKTGREPSANDATELERVTQEQAGLQKQLESYRKQVKQHQMQTQDYRTKKRERYGQDWAFSQMPPVTGPAIMNVPPGGLQPRIPGQQGSARLTASARQAYDEYMQDRLRQNQQIPGAVGGPRPKHTVVEDNKTKVAGPKAILQDNNPFSEEYQEREQRERVGCLPKPGPEPVEKPEMIRQMPPYFDPRTMPYDQTGRFPAPRMPGPAEPMQRFPGPGQHMPFDPSAARMPGPQDSTPRHQFPPRMYTPMNQGQVEGAPVGPHPQMPYQPGFSTPASDMSTNVESGEKKSKKRKKKKKAAESPAATTVGTAEPRPPVQFTPQSETEKRIMEILNNSAGLAARSQHEAVDRSPGKAKAGDTQGPPATEQKPEGRKPEEGEGAQRVTTVSVPGPSTQPTYTTAVSQPAYQSESNDPDDQQEEHILPMNVMIHQSIPQSAAIACSVPPVQVSQSQQMEAARIQESESTPQTAAKSVEGSVQSDQGHTQKRPPNSGSAEAQPVSSVNSNVNTVQEPETVSTNVQHLPPHSYPMTSLPGHPLPPPNTQERMSPRGMVPPAYMGAYGHFQGRMSPRQAHYGGAPPTLMPVSQNQSPRQSTTPSPGRYSPRQASPSYTGGPSPGRYSPRQGSPGVSRPPSRPPSQPGSGYAAPRQGPTPPITGYPSSTPPASPNVTYSPVTTFSAVSVDNSTRVETSVAHTTINSRPNVSTSTVQSVSQNPPTDSVAPPPATESASAPVVEQSNVKLQDTNTSVNVSQTIQASSASSVSTSETVTTASEQSQEVPSSKDADQ